MNKWLVAIAFSGFLLVPIGSQNAFADVTSQFERLIPKFEIVVEGNDPDFIELNDPSAPRFENCFRAFQNSGDIDALRDCSDGVNRSEFAISFPVIVIDSETDQTVGIPTCDPPSGSGFTPGSHFIVCSFAGLETPFDFTFNEGIIDFSRGVTVGNPTATAVATDTSGNLYYISENFVIKLSPDGLILDKWGGDEAEHGFFNGVSAIAVNSGNVYIVDTFNHRIVQYSTSGAFIRSWGSQGNGDGQFSFPLGITTDNDGNVYVADTGNHRIQKFDQHGNFIGWFGKCDSGDNCGFGPIGLRSAGFICSSVTCSGLSSGNELGQFSSPQDVDFDFAANRLIVADTGNQRVQSIPLDDALFVRELEPPPEDNSGIGSTIDEIVDNLWSGNIIDIAFGASNTLLMLDDSENIVIVIDMEIDPATGVTTRIGQIAPTNEPALFVNPEKIAYDIFNKKLYVSDGKIKKFSISILETLSCPNFTIDLTGALISSGLLSPFPGSAVGIDLLPGETVNIPIIVDTIEPSCTGRTVNLEVELANSIVNSNTDYELKFTDTGTLQTQGIFLSSFEKNLELTIDSQTTQKSDEILFRITGTISEPGFVDIETTVTQFFLVRVIGFDLRITSPADSNLILESSRQVDFKQQLDGKPLFLFPSADVEELRIGVARLCCDFQGFEAGFDQFPEDIRVRISEPIGIPEGFDIELFEDVNDPSVDCTDSRCIITIGNTFEELSLGNFVNIGLFVNENVQFGTYNFPLSAISLVTGVFENGILSLNYLPNLDVGNNQNIETEIFTNGIEFIDLTFSQVSQPGNARVTFSQDGPPPTSGFKLEALGESNYFEITSTAETSGEITIFINFINLQPNWRDFELMHFVDGNWEKITVDKSQDFIKGVTSSLSTFAIFSPVDNDIQVIGGKIIPIETTSLILANTQTFSWMIPVAVSIAGIGLFVVFRKSE